MRTKPHILVFLGWNDPRLLAGIGCYAREQGWSLSLNAIFSREVPTHWDGDGAIVTPSHNPVLDVFLAGLADRIPVVCLSGDIGGRKLPQVKVEQRVPGELAARYFLERGFCSFAWFTTRSGPIDTLRGGAFRDLAASAGHPCAMLHFPGEDEMRRSERSRWLASRLKNLPKPLALFCSDDLHAVEAIDECLAHDLRVPEDIAVLGVGNVELACECSQIPVSSMEYDFEGMGRAAAQLLHQTMEGHPDPDPGPLFLPGPVITRQSTDMLATSDPRLAKAIDYIRRHLSKDLGAADIARAAGTPLRTLQHLAREHLDSSPARLILRLRLEKARDLLARTDLAIRDIAATTGFKSSRNITRCFQRELGFTPGQYRRSKTSD